MLCHHGTDIGLRHARKHLGWALDVAAATAGASLDTLKRFRARALTAEREREVKQALTDAYDAFGWRAAA
jgi:tRNA-dihydrouridine synthase B